MSDACRRSSKRMEILAALTCLIGFHCLLSPPKLSAQSTFDALQNNVWYLPTTDGKCRLYVTSLGHGPTVVVIHGGPGNDFNYLVDMVYPQIANHKFIFYDQRGSLLSPVAAANRGTLTAQQMVEDLDQLRRSIGEEKLVLLAHSWGSYLAMLYYQAHPEHVAALVLVGSFPPRTPPGQTFDQMMQSVHARQNALRARPVVAFAEKQAGVDGPVDKLSARQRWTRLRIEGLASTNLYHVERWPQFQGEGVYYSEEADSAIGDSLPKSFDLTPTIMHTPVPITVLQGDHDYVDPSAQSWAFLKGRSNLKIFVLPRASHYGWIDAPALFQSDLRRALASIVSSNATR